MELAIFVYLASLLMKIDFILGGVILGSGCYCLIRVVFAVFNSSEYDKKYNTDVYARAEETLRLKWIKKHLCVILLCSVVSALLPSERTMYTMLAAYAGQKVVQSDTADKVLKVLNSKLDEYLSETEKEKK